MAKTSKTAWGIDVGNCTLKAIKLSGSDDDVEVLDFAVIEHEKILSQPDLEPQQRVELINKALTKFMDEHEVGSSTVVVSVPGQSSFARFIKLPPVENKRIPEIVKFEATQQIPFDINQVEWDWQSFQTESSTEVEVGIFAIKKELVGQVLQPFTAVSCPVHIVQMAPMALYNFLYQDQPRLRDASSKEAIILLDIGAENTDLVIADGIRVWQRSIPIGGNQFTAAVQKAFKLGFAKAEAIKRSASTSKYARQIFQAMRSVFADLAAEVQRSLGFYSSSNRDVQFRQVLALGNTMKLPGLVKFLQQSLSLPVKRLSSFETLKLSADISAAQFSDNLPSFTVAYGLAVQGLENGAIHSNLLPRDLARQTQWQRKRPWFVAAAAVFLGASLINLFQAYSARSDINSDVTRRNLETIEANKQLINDKSLEKSTLESAITQAETEINSFQKYYTQRETIPRILQAIRDCLPNEKNSTDDRQKRLHQAFAEGNREAVLEIPREDREQIFLNSIKIIPVDDINTPFDKVVADAGSSSPAGRGGGPAAAMGAAGGIPGAAGGVPGVAGAGAAGAGAGYVIVVEGTTPHKAGIEFLQVPRAERDAWGFFQKLRYLGKTDAVIAAEAQAREAFRVAQQSQPAGTAAGGVNPMTGAYPPVAGGAYPPVAGGAYPPVAGVVDPGAPPGDPASATASEPTALVPEYQDYPGHIAPSDLPFETYINPQDLNPTSSFDISNWGPLSVPNGPNHKPLQPDIATIGIIQEAEEETNTQTLNPSALPAGTQPTAGSKARMMSLEVYLDPFTHEVINETYILDAEGNQVLDRTGKARTETHDFWFRVMFKIRMKPYIATLSTGEGIN